MKHEVLKQRRPAENDVLKVYNEAHTFYFTLSEDTAYYEEGDDPRVHSVIEYILKSTRAREVRRDGKSLGKLEVHV